MSFDEFKEKEHIELSHMMQDIAVHYHRAMIDAKRSYQDVLFDMRIRGEQGFMFTQAGLQHRLKLHELEKEFETAQKQALADFQQNQNRPAPEIPIKSAYDIMVEEASNTVIAQEADIEL